MSAVVEKRLLEMKAGIDEAKKKEAGAKGALDQLYADLEREEGIKTLEEAEALSKQIDHDAGELERQAEDKVADLEKRYEWGS